MPFNFGTTTIFDDPLSIHDPVVLAAARAVNLPIFKGVFYNIMSAPTIPISTHKYLIYSRSKSTRNGVIGNGAGTGWNSSSTSNLPMTAAAVKGLTIGHVLLIEDEVVQVDSVDRSANTVNVKGRGLGGTLPAAHTDQTAFTVIGYAGADGDLKKVESVTESTLNYENYVQTIFELLDWEYGAEMERKGVDSNNIITILRQEAAYRAAESLSTMCINSRKQMGSKGGANYMSAGLLTQLGDDDGGNRPVITYNANGVFTEEKLRFALREVFQTGSPDIILCSLNNKNTINDFNAANNKVQLTTDMFNHQAGTHIDSYNYEGAVLAVEADADMPDNRIAIITSALCKKGWMQGDTMRNVSEPTQSSRERKESIQGSIGFSIEGVGYDHSLIKGITQN